MKVFVVTEYVVVDFRCGDTYIKDIFDNFDKAFALVKELVPNASPDDKEWIHWDHGYDDSATLYISEHEVK